MALAQVHPQAQARAQALAHSLAHSLALGARGGTLPPEGVPAGVVLDSWARCVQAGLDPHARLSVPVVEAHDLRQRQQRSAAVRQLARAELETLSRQIAGSNFLLAFADHDGVILDLYADNRFSMSDPGAGIVAGSCWSEQLSGTNGLGTALATGAAVAVTGMEHYFLSLGNVSCTAAPVRDARGEIVGVLDASSYFESRQRHTQALVQMAATHIENGLLLQQMRPHWVLAIHPRPEFLSTLSAGLLAFDETGRLVAQNARANQLLQGLDAMPGTAFESLFGEPFERVIARLQRQGESGLRDAFGSTLVATCLSRPTARSPSSTFNISGPRTASAAEASVTAALPGGADCTRPATRTPRSAPDGAVIDDQAVANAYTLVEAAVRRQLPLLLTGETGTGKEMLARHAHRSSKRSGPFVAVNCGALPAELIEAELFGYVGGAFSGARREGSIGLIASADGGTLLLDELGELPMPLQASLLRFLDDRQVRPVGGTAARTVDVQLLAATHVDLDAEAAARRFRADLLYRLNTVSVQLPPLRQRADFATAVRAVLATLDPAARISDDAIERLARHGWPGNFRELRSVLTRTLLQGSGRIQAADVAPWLPTGTPAPTTMWAAAATSAGAAPTPATAHASQPASALQLNAGEVVRQAFERFGNVSATARALGISRTTVYRHLR